MKLTERKRQDIINAAIEEFREQGFLGAKTTRIASRAEVSSRTLYKHFESKEALFEAICEIMLERSKAMAPVAYDPGRDLAEQLTEALHSYVAVLTDENSIGLYRTVISEMLRDLDRAALFFAKAASHEYPMAQLVSEAMAAGALRRDDPARATGHLLALVKNAYFWPKFLIDQQTDAPGMMEECVAIFLAYYAPKG